jgi:hypothetical protein
VGEVAEGFVEDFVALAVGAAEEVGLVGAVFVPAYDGGYMNGAVSGWHAGDYSIKKVIVNSDFFYLLATSGSPK